MGGGGGVAHNEGSFVMSLLRGTFSNMLKHKFRLIGPNGTTNQIGNQKHERRLQ